jgi:hypothetical protein
LTFVSLFKLCGALEAAEKLDFDYLEMKKSTYYFRRIREIREQGAYRISDLIMRL